MGKTAFSLEEPPCERTGFFTKRYGVHQLVWYELHESMESAIEREKRLKEWKRVWKLELIESANLDWEDLYDTIV